MHRISERPRLSPAYSQLRNILNAPSPKDVASTIDEARVEMHRITDALVAEHYDVQSRLTAIAESIMAPTRPGSDDFVGRLVHLFLEIHQLRHFGWHCRHGPRRCKESVQGSYAGRRGKAPACPESRFGRRTYGFILPGKHRVLQGDVCGAAAYRGKDVQSGIRRPDKGSRAAHLR